MRAEGIAAALDLEPSSNRVREWVGVRDGACIGLLSTPVGRGAEMVTLFVEHDVSLRTGLLLEERRLMDDAVGMLLSRPELELGISLTGVRARAAEEKTARAVLRSVAGTITRMAALGELAIDDQRAWLARYDEISISTAEDLFDGLDELSDELVEARRHETTTFDGELASGWGETAKSYALGWAPDRSMITGERHGMVIELRVDGQPGLLYTELFVAWPSINLGLAIDREGPRGTPGPKVASDDPRAVVRAFNREMRVRARTRESLAAGLELDAMRGALAIAATGASLSIDDTGLVARVDRVESEAGAVRALLEGALAIGTGLATPAPKRSIYR